jgi:hypothetical protein
MSAKFRVDAKRQSVRRGKVYKPNAPTEFQTVIEQSGSLRRNQTSAEEAMIQKLIAEYRTEKLTKQR